jgi:asparagine synthase (glutamine-hydrolysing)
MKERHAHALSTLRHRGPDGEGQYEDGNVWLAHTRLSILDLSEAGDQPMQSADKRFVISYNGEVYNFRELAAQHGLDNLRSSSDTEVVLRLFAKLGIGSLAELNGMFAFALYDRQMQKVWLVRDRLGIKPLYYRVSSTGLVFASEIKAILALCNEQPSCNISALHEWLYYGNTLGGRTLYDGIEQLLPGQYLEIDLRSFEHSVDTYWSLQQEVARGCNRPNKKDMVAETRRLLEQAIHRQLVSDVPVGVFLSGGIDSSAIAAFASRHYQGRLATYSAGFDFAPDGGELPKAKRVAERYGTEHHEIHIRGRDIGDLVGKMVDHHDMPFSDAANIPLYLMAAQLGGFTKVILQGDGGDELFGGYRRYATLRYYNFLRPLARFFQHIQSVTPKSKLHYRIARYLHAFAGEDVATTMALLLTPEDRVSHPLNIFSSALSQRIVGAADPFARYRQLQPVFSDQDIGNQMSLVDMSIVLPDTYLEKVDRSTMAASLEVRVPFLDNDLVSYVVQLSGHSKMPFGRKKRLLKRSLKGIVPDEILYGPKRGFQVPYGHWLQTSLKSLFFDNLATLTQRQPGILNDKHVESLFAQTSSGRQNHSALLWKILNFLVWANRTDIDFTEKA